MTREYFVKALLEADSVWDIYNLVHETVVENEVRDDEGNLITRETNLARLRFDPKKVGMPTVRVSIYVAETVISVGPDSLRLPTAFLCTFLRQMAHLHHRWHQEGAKLLDTTAGSFLGDMEKVISETLGRGFMHPN